MRQNFVINFGRRNPNLVGSWSFFIKECINNKIDIYPIPGASSITTSMSISGFEDKFIFYGFLPKKKNK